MIHSSLNFNLISSFEDLERCVSEQILNTRGIILEAGYFSEKDAILTDFLFFIETHVYANWSFGTSKSLLVATSVIGKVYVTNDYGSKFSLNMPFVQTSW